jgi:hypothetical protein
MWKLVNTRFDGGRIYEGIKKCVTDGRMDGWMDGGVKSEGRK